MELTGAKLTRNLRHCRLNGMMLTVRAITAGLVCALTIAACGGGEGPAPAGSAPAGSAPAGAASAPAPTGGGGQINGAGATFPNPIYSKWFDEYNKLNPKVRINYQSV